MKVTAGDLAVLFLMLGLAALLFVLADLAARMLERLSPEPDPIDQWLQPSHVKMLTACHTCGEPSEDLQPHTTTPLVDPEPTCPRCVERDRAEYEDLLHLSWWDTQRERI